jgi:hypothetical protein
MPRGKGPLHEIHLLVHLQFYRFLGEKSATLLLAEGKLSVNNLGFSSRGFASPEFIIFTRFGQMLVLLIISCFYRQNASNVQL